MSLRSNAFAFLLIVLAGCGGTATEDSLPVVVGDGAETAGEAVSELVDAMSSPDFVEASRLAMPGHAALASLAEGASFSEVAEALREGDSEIAANFWTGFAQETTGLLGGEVDVAEGETFTQDGVDFQVVVVTPASGPAREVIVRDSGGYRVDLFASFGAGLADKLSAQVERLIATQTDDARLIMEGLRGIVPSLLAAAQRPGISGQVSQDLLSLVEVITRVG
jgi:hypothetical protein